MEEADEQPLVTWTHLIYGLHSLSLIAFIFGLARVMGAFLLACPSLIAVILNLVKRSDVRGTWLESHFRWQIRTFWYGLLWVSMLWPWTPGGTSASSVLPRLFCALGPGVCVLFLMAALAIAMVIALLPLGVLSCSAYHKPQLGTDQIGGLLTCAGVRIASLWFLYRIARGGRRSISAGRCTHRNRIW